MASTKHWARFLRKAHVEFCPFDSSASGLGFYQMLTAPSVRKAVPKLAVKAKREVAPLAKDVLAAQRLKLTFVDGSEHEHDIRPLTIKDILLEIEMQNGRLEMEAMKNGKPW